MIEKNNFWFPNFTWKIKKKVKHWEVHVGKKEKKGKRNSKRKKFLIVDIHFFWKFYFKKKEQLTFELKLEPRLFRIWQNKKKKKRNSELNQPELTWIWVIFKVNFHFFFSHIRKRSDLEARLRRFFVKLSNFCSKWNSQQRTIHPPQIDQFFTDRFNSQQNSREFQQTKTSMSHVSSTTKAKNSPAKKINK